MLLQYIHPDLIYVEGKFPLIELCFYYCIEDLVEEIYSFTFQIFKDQWAEKKRLNAVKSLTLILTGFLFLPAYHSVYCNDNLSRAEKEPSSLYFILMTLLNVTN